MRFVLVRWVIDNKKQSSSKVRVRGHKPFLCVQPNSWKPVHQHPLPEWLCILSYLLICLEKYSSTCPDHDEEFMSLLICTFKRGKKSRQINQHMNCKHCYLISLGHFTKNISVCICRVLQNKKVFWGFTWVTNRCNKLTALSFPELNFISHFLLTLKCRAIWFWTHIYISKHGAILSIKQLKAENSYVKPPCFNWILKYRLTYSRQASKYLPSSQLSPHFRA